MSGTARVVRSPVPGVADAESLAVVGDVTLDGAAALRPSLVGAVETTGAKRVVMELGGVDEIDTSGAALLIEAFLAGRRRGIRVLFCRPSGSVLRLFELSGFKDVLEACCSDPAEAMARLSA